MNGGWRVIIDMASPGDKPRLLYFTLPTTLPNTIRWPSIDPLTLFQKKLNQELKANEKRHCAHSPAQQQAVWHSQ